MSLNWREIDAVLAEWSPAGLRLRQVRQPDYRRVILEFSGPGNPAAVALVLAPPFVRLHRVGDDARLPKALPRPPRFTAVLKSRLVGARLIEVRQLGQDRIVRFAFERAGSRLNLDAKLWGNAANLLLTDANGGIIDAFSRRPKRGEIPGGHWPPEGVGEDPKGNDSGESDRFVLRDLPGEGDWNRRVERYYAALERQTDRNRRIESWHRHLDRRESTLDTRQVGIDRSAETFADQAHDGHWGDLIMAHLHVLRKGDTVLDAEDWEEPGRRVTLRLDPELSPRDNAERYYARQRRSRRGLERLEEDRRALEVERDRISELRRRLETGDMDAPPLDADPPQPRGSSDGGPGFPGLWIRREPYTIAVGRNAAESDTLLRRWAKGNDWWLHARDWPGGHVFVRAPRGKSVPLDVLLDAGNLALSYSKGRTAGEADLYYTQVKYLRRAKDGPKGTVLPTREKNLHVRLDQERLNALKSRAEGG